MTDVVKIAGIGHRQKPDLLQYKRLKYRGDRMLVVEEDLVPRTWIGIASIE